MTSAQDPSAATSSGTQPLLLLTTQLSNEGVAFAGEKFHCQLQWSSQAPSVHSNAAAGTNHRIALPLPQSPQTARTLENPTMTLSSALPMKPQSLSLWKAQQEKAQEEQSRNHSGILSAQARQQLAKDREQMEKERAAKIDAQETTVKVKKTEDPAANTVVETQKVNAKQILSELESVQSSPPLAQNIIKNNEIQRMDENRKGAGPYQKEAPNADSGYSLLNWLWPFSSSRTTVTSSVEPERTDSRMNEFVPTEQTPLNTLALAERQGTLAAPTPMPQVIQATEISPSDSQAPIPPTPGSNPFNGEPTMVGNGMPASSADRRRSWSLDSYAQQQGMPATPRKSMDPQNAMTRMDSIHRNSLDPLIIPNTGGPKQAGAAMPDRESMDSLFSPVDSLNTSMIPPTGNAIKFPQGQGTQPLSIDTTVNLPKAEVALAYCQLIGYLCLTPSRVSPNKPIFPEFVMEELMLLNKRWFTHSRSGGYLLSTDQEKELSNLSAIPVLISPPTVLFAQLNLKQGHNEVFNFETILPQMLPPSYRGRLLKIVYQLVVGVQKSIYDPPVLIQLPFRVMPSIAADGSHQEYSLINPIVLTKEHCMAYNVGELQLAVPHSPTVVPSSLSSSLNAMQRSDVLSFIKTHSDDMLAKKLNESGFAGNVAGMPPKKRVVPVEDKMAGITAENSFLFTQRPSKAVFDICKNNQRIVQARLHRSCLQLGDTVQITLDFSKNQLPCYQLSAWLECIETVSEELLGPASQEKGEKKHEYRRKVAEWYSSVLNTRRVLVSLCIPNSQAPEFSTTFVNVTWQVRLEFITAANHTPFMVKADTKEPMFLTVQEGTPPMLSPQSEDQSADLNEPSLQKTDQNLLGPAKRPPTGHWPSYESYTLAKEVSCDVFDCTIPLRVFPNKFSCLSGGAGVAGSQSRGKSKFALVQD